MKHMCRNFVALAMALAVSGSVRGASNDAPRFCFVGVWDRAMPIIEDTAKQLGVTVSYYRPNRAGSADVFNEFQDHPGVVFLLNLDSAEAIQLREKLAAIAGKNPKLKIIPLDKRGVHAEFEKGDLLTKDENIPKYWRPNGTTNIKRLFRYTLVTYFGASGEIEPPVLVPDYGFYEPGHEEPFSDFNACKEFKQNHGNWKAGAPAATLIIQQSFWITHDTRVTDAQVRALEKNGINAVVIFGDTQARVANLLQQTKPDLVIEDRHGGMWENGELLEKLDVPYLRPVSMLAYTLDEWLSDPRGLSSRDVGMFMTVQESWGTIEPVVVGGLKANLSGFKLHEPYDKGIERFAARAAAWLRLKKAPNAGKKIALIYYNKSLGKDDLMRGSPTGAFLNGPESAVRFLPRLKERGFKIDTLPKDSDELIAWIKRGGRNIGPWAKGELDDLVKNGDPALVPLTTYQKWFSEKLSAENQKRVTDKYGPPPGKMMVIDRNGEKHLVIPRISLGNILLMPQPERGEKQDETLLHSRDLPPPHNYLAFYWWLQKEYKADAIIHWGTHGSLELLPGKEAGMTQDCWSDICTGNLPVVDLWITDNLAEATLARRRSYAQLVDHMPPPAMASGLSDAYNSLHDDLDKFAVVEEGVLKQEYRKRISEAVRKEKLDQELKLTAGDGLLKDGDIEKVLTHIHMLYENRTPLTLHVLGVPPPDKDLGAYLVSILGRKFEEHIAAVEPPPAEMDNVFDKHMWLNRKAVELADSTLIKGQAPGKPLTPELEKDIAFGKQMLVRLRQTDDEITGLLRALEVHYIKPGPGPDPIRNPSTAPGGRNLYSLNPEEIPTRAAWEVGKQLVEEMLKKKMPKKVGMDLNGMETMRDFGVIEAQTFYLLGVQPVWDRNNLCIDVELIPREELKRPRIDVFVALGGLYKENFPTRVELLDKAVRLAASAKEQDNLVRLGSQSQEKRLKEAGFTPEQAAQLATARIFGAKPGNMTGTNILYLIPRSGVWDKEDEVADVYVDSMSYVYTKGVWGQKVDGLYQQAIQNTDTLIRVWASNMTSQLSNHHAYEYLGGLSMAVRKYTGKEAEAFIADVRDPNGVRMRDFQEVLTTTMKAELLNPKWIQGMKEQGYAGAGHAAELVKNTFGWSISRKDSISDAMWNEIASTYIEDSQHLGLREWFEKNNPHALQEIAATMLEASRKGYWNASPETLEKLSSTFAEIAVKHGDSGGLVSGGNKKLEEYASGILNAPGNQAGATLAAQMTEALKKAAGSKPDGETAKSPAQAAPPPPPAAAAEPPKSAAQAAPKQEPVTGFQLKPADAAPENTKQADWVIIVLAAGSVLLLLYGFIARKGAV
jgi:cobaltochelatase CobN